MSRFRKLIIGPTALTKKPAGFSLACDAGKWNKYKLEYIRCTFFYEREAIFLSTHVYVVDITLNQTGLALAENKLMVFDALKMSQSEITECLMGCHGDGAYSGKYLKVLDKMKVMYRANALYSNQIDICHMIDTANKHDMHLRHYIHIYQIDTKRTKIERVLPGGLCYHQI